MCETPQGVRYIVDAAVLAAKLDDVRQRLLSGAQGIPAAVAQLELLSYALTHPNAPTFAVFDGAQPVDFLVEDLAELWRGQPPAPMARPALRVVNDG